ncbi:hypothetical protein AB0442_37590 [Kitasatospora sp. NPDC085895]|uniref:hypothetical protein n=1 Tax=Kitasatospora sp. NPDC085895 TaxID=3155057 RepID=UPI003450045D
MTAQNTTGTLVGARDPHELGRLLAAANTHPFCTGRFGRGVLEALRWALGHQVTAPITAIPLNGVLRSARLWDEVDAARTELLGHGGRTVELDYARGVYEALAWVCGHREHPPQTPGR